MYSTSTAASTADSVAAFLDDVGFRSLLKDAMVSVAIQLEKPGNRDSTLRTVWNMFVKAGAKDLAESGGAAGYPAGGDDALAELESSVVSLTRQLAGMQALREQFAEEQRLRRALEQQLAAADTTLARGGHS